MQKDQIDATETESDCEEAKADKASSVMQALNLKKQSYTDPEQLMGLLKKSLASKVAKAVETQQPEPKLNRWGNTVELVKREKERADKYQQRENEMRYQFFKELSVLRSQNDMLQATLHDECDPDMAALREKALKSEQYQKQMLRTTKFFDQVKGIDLTSK